ncbi:MAG TPA: pyridoxal-dependent decarboxylase [Steroidobacteraceae bacterium]|nr:pyridoxal-dependent decarboxylase [Steroidobacteraceae bacterium]
MAERYDLPAPPVALFPDAAQGARTDDWLTAQIRLALARINQGSVMPTVDLARFRQELAALDFAAPMAAEALLSWTLAQLEQGTVHMTHPRYFGLFNPAPTAPAQWADRIAGAFNPQLASTGSSPVPVEIEAHVIRAMASRAGLPTGSVGHFTTSGSEANYTALICALTHANPRFGDDGVRAFAGPVALYTSADCHPAWSKIAHQAGVGRHALRLVPTDGSGRLDALALEKAVQADKAKGVTPVLIAATAGTTGGGMIDPLPACARLCAAQGIWFHVDAAWGGAALCSDRLRGLLSGIELADSITIDAHKWFATTMGCGMFLVRHGAVLSEAFRVAADFMPSSAISTDPYLNTVQWSRRFLGLRLFLSLGMAGWQGFAAHVERGVAVIAQVRERLVGRGWTVANDSSLAVLCVEPPRGGPAVRDIVRRTLDSGRAWVARSTFEGREVVRICATHGQCTLADVETLVSVLTG